MPQDFFPAARDFAREITSKFALSVDFAPEDQLKPSVVTLLKQAGATLSLDVNGVTEVKVAQLGRPDIGVTTGSLLTGHIELKAPGKGADPNKLKDADKRQWERFRDLPNLIYTDGNQWALYRSGERLGKLLRLPGDVTSEGPQAVSPEASSLLLNILRDFLQWQPIVPSTPRALAHMLAPICRLLRECVVDALQDPSSNISALAQDWRRYLFPDADDKQFADAYAQTFTYGLLLARLSGSNDLSLSSAVQAIRPGHNLLADTLKILGDDAARAELSVPIGLLERIIAALDSTALSSKAKQDPWLYFYEDFLAAYDPQMRKDRGVYYTPLEVVHSQVRLVSELLESRLGLDASFADPKVLTLDPAAGTGTYLLAALDHALARLEEAKGHGIRASFATIAASNMHAFEILVGPYSVAHLRLTQKTLAEGGALPADGVHVYLTDTLESPHQVPPQLPLLYKELGEEHKRALKVKSATPIIVCIGNPPYDRQQATPSTLSSANRKGGWVRFGDTGHEADAILDSFLAPLREHGLGIHAKNLYNDYVYFWRWALWKVLESKKGPGIISFITASSYLRGPGFTGMRQFIRQVLDELWIIDLEGDNLGARRTENVFAIQTPVAIAIGIRHGSSDPATPARVHYTRLLGSQEEKLKQLDAINQFSDLSWNDALEGWTAPFLPVGGTAFWQWPLLTGIFPRQENGVQFKRSWPIGESASVLAARWDTLIRLSPNEKPKALRETDAKKAYKPSPSLEPGAPPLTAIAQLPLNTPPPPTIRYAFRSFDRQWALLDPRLCDRPRPSLHRSHGPSQIYLTSLLTEVLGEGPSAVVTCLIPDLHHFRGSFGGAHIVPLWRDTAATKPNITPGVLQQLSSILGHQLTPDQLFAYCYALLASPSYVQRFWDELSIPGPRVPITKNFQLFDSVAQIGRTLIWLHTFAERMTPPGQKPGKVPNGRARCRVGSSPAPDRYPQTFNYSAALGELTVGDAVFENVRPEVWAFSVSGLEVVKSWLEYRMRDRAGKKSSPLDDLRPSSWEFDEELLDLLWILDATVDIIPALNQALQDVLASELFKETDFPSPTDADRQPLQPSAPFQTSFPLADSTSYSASNDDE